MPSFCITEDNRLTVAMGARSLRASARFPQQFVVSRALHLDPYGSIPAGARCLARLDPEDGVVTLTFVSHWPALRQWDNILLLFPDCVDAELLECLQVVPEKPAGPLGLIWKAARAATLFLATAV